MLDQAQIKRRPSRRVYVGDVPVGDGAPITVQSMTNTPTKDAEATIAQIKRLEEAGADIVRVSCPDEDSTAAFKQIAKAARVPLVADIHFHYKRGIEAAQAGAKCLRINPGNIGALSRVREVIQAARDHNCSMRIGVNAGSLESHLLEKYGEPNADALVESALEHAKILEDEDFLNFKISVKASDVHMALKAYRKLAKATDAPLHIGITEAGSLRMGLVRSSIGLGMLLSDGIGDTLRVSLAADPVEEVYAGFNMLKALRIRQHGVNIVACPSCARQNFPVIKTVQILEEKLAHIKTPLTVSIIGCVVNGPGEALKSDIGVTGGGKDNHALYINGKVASKIHTGEMVDHVVELVEQKAAEIEASKAA